MWEWLFVSIVFFYEVLHLFAEVFLKPRPGAACRAVVIVPTRRPRDLSKFAGAVDYVVVDDNIDAAHAERVGLRWIFNKYVGKSGALATALEELDADVYVFLDDDAEPGQWLEELKKCRGSYATAYRWVRDKLQNAFSLGGFDWMVWKKTRFIYGGAVAVPKSERQTAIDVLKRCAVDDMALSRVAKRIEVLPLFVPMEPAPRTWEFFTRQAVAAKLGNATLWLAESIYYAVWVAAAIVFPPLFVIQLIRTGLRSKRALGRVDWGQVAIAPIERFLDVFVFIISSFQKCFHWRGRTICGGCG
ncbi:MAG: glycosyltransferase family 2 protein [Pyrobaculum sp.]